ncbi:MAG TPA: cell envelope integrity protein CreD [Flavisolibacter sp.]
METIIQSAWSKSKLLVKGLIIGILVLLLQIPALYVRELIDERQQRQKEAITEVSDKWAGRQTIAGPMVVLPYWNDADTSAGRKRQKELAYFLPHQLNIHATVTPQEKYRGIYKVMLYRSKIRVSGHFREADLAKLNIDPQSVLWNEAYLRFDLSDLKGLHEEMTMTWKDRQYALSPQTTDATSSVNGLYTPLAITGIGDLQNATFSSDLSLNGSEQLRFTPLGKVTKVDLVSTWPHPSFTGNILPQVSHVKDSGFTAQWKSLAHNRSFPQQWKNQDFILAAPGHMAVPEARNVAAFSFGADLFVPVNAYQKTERSVKYAALCILLTFAAFFLIETTNRKSVHPFQYALVGLALIMFYTLLLSFSEYIGFNLSYAIASVCTIMLIGWFARSILSSMRLATILSTVLVLMYLYVFTILQLQDYSLLFGSIGLFITLAVVMYFSRKIEW